MTPSKRTSIARGATGLPRYYMDVAWWTGPGWLGASLAEVGLRDAIQSYCMRHGTDGRVPADPRVLAIAIGFDPAEVRRVLPKIIARTKPDGRPVLEVDGDELVIPGYEDHNPTKAEVDAYYADKSEAGKRGNHKRHHTDKGVVSPECDLCQNSPSRPPPDPPPDPTSGRTCDPTSDRNTDRETLANGSHGMGWDGMGVPSQSSSNIDAVSDHGCEPDDDDDDREPSIVDQAYAVIAARRAADQGGKGSAWRAAVAFNLPTDEHHPGPQDPVTYETQTAWLLESFVIDTAEQLADALTGRLSTRNLTRRTDTRTA